MAFQKPARSPKPRRFPTLSGIILEKLAELGEVAVGSFFPAKYPEARLWRSLLGLDAHYHFRRDTFSTLLSRLRAQGLIVRSGSNRRSRWRLTSRGEAHLGAITGAERVRSDGVRRLVIFDIPEKERAKRGAIRIELTAAGFRQLQKSVWYGERPLPEDFLELLDALRLRRHVHIFSVREQGTLASLA